ncbi:type II toxin-antitoxin system death-on-curing family toxin [Candidatus Woesearchaeota archaeon]|nr:type II toxin-antitoxin system death-on-curing family toxin [Candidatus Woesearchaeota archaeon]
MIKYPAVEDIVAVNAKVVAEIKIKKADKHEVLSLRKIEDALDLAKKKRGDLYEKSVILFKGIIQAHPFASGNRRTAFTVVENFLLYNGEKPKVNKATPANVLQGIREDYYKDSEIKKWLRGGKINEFKR